MPELEDLLAAEAARYDIRHYPVTGIRQRRQRRVLVRASGAFAIAAVLGAALLLLPGPGQDRDGVVAGGSARRLEGGPRIDGLRTDAHGSALVATYTGGACGGPASLRVAERADRVEVAVEVLPGPGVDENHVCPAIGIGRSVRGELSAPLADRTVVADGKQVKPYDGANLVVPGRLPDGFVLQSETGRLGFDDWTQSYGTPRSTALGAPCRAGQRSLGISTGPRVLDGSSASYFRDEGPVNAGDGAARLHSQDGAPVRYLDLRVHGQPVALAYGADCGGKVPSVQELLDIAKSLQPVGP